jgi:hypothetical protein
MDEVTINDHNLVGARHEYDLAVGRVLHVGNQRLLVEAEFMLVCSGCARHRVVATTLSKHKGRHTDDSAGGCKACCSPEKVTPGDLLGPFGLHDYLL